MFLETLHYKHLNDNKLTKVEINENENVVSCNIKKAKFNSQPTSGLIHPNNKGNNYSHQKDSFGNTLAQTAFLSSSLEKSLTITS